VDAAALAAALQFREGFLVSELDASAIEFLNLNGISDPNALVQVCMDNPGSPPSIHHNSDLCPLTGEMARKLVRVVATGTAHLAFLPVIGINQAPISAEATSETASVDVVLLLDRSESMTYDVPPGSGVTMRDPSVCNYAQNPNAARQAEGYQGYCLPFDVVKRAAVSFVEQLYFPYDRVSVVTFDKDPTVVMNFTNVKSDIISAIKNLTVFQGEVTSDPDGMNAIYPNGNPSRIYIGGDYYGLSCPRADTDPAVHAPYPDYNPAPCTTTNIGAGLYSAGVRFNVEPIRRNSLWVVILLTDGVANAGYGESATYFCPESTWLNADTWVAGERVSILPKCNDGYSNTHHPSTNPVGPDYDAEDYAYDGADFVSLSQNALLFTIGLGDQVRSPSTLDGTLLGEIFLEHAAEIGGGTYTFNPNSAGLIKAFQDIARNIATRLAH
jgi:hypothetical protein